MTDSTDVLANAPDVWGGGQLLAFSGIDGATDFQAGLVARTPFYGTGLEVKLPARCRLEFSSRPPVSTRLSGDALRLVTPEGTVRGAFLDAYHILLEGPCRVAEKDAGIASLSREGRTLVGTASRFRPELLRADLDGAQRDRTAWLSARSIPAGLGASRRRTYGKALSQLKTMVYGPEGAIRRRYTTPDRWPHQGMWLWDSAFHAVGLRRLDAALAREILEALFDGQQADGRVPLRIDPDGVDQRFTQPPLIALAAMEIQEADPDPEWLRRIFPALEAYLRWDLAHRDGDGDGFLEWAVTDEVTCRSGESGMDNSPRFDGGARIAAVDFNSFMAHECELMERMAALLRLPDRAREWGDLYRRRAAAVGERFWDPRLGFYFDWDPAGRRLLPVRACSGFYPLLCGAADAEQAALLAEKLADPRWFATPLPVPTISADDATHYAKDMWRGPVWMNVNWLVARGLERYGFRREADGIRRASVEEVERHYLRYGTLFEFFDDRREVDPPALLRKGECNPGKSPYRQVFHDYGWTASLYVDMVHALAGR